AGQMAVRMDPLVEIGLLEPRLPPEGAMAQQNVLQCKKRLDRSKADLVDAELRCRPFDRILQFGDLAARHDGGRPLRRRLRRRAVPAHPSARIASLASWSQRLFHSLSLCPFTLT